MLFLADLKSGNSFRISAISISSRNAKLRTGSIGVAKLERHLPWTEWADAGRGAAMSDHNLFLHKTGSQSRARLPLSLQSSVRPDQ